LNAATRAAVVLLSTLVAVGLTARLGIWQLDRAAQKEALQSQLDDRLLLAPLAASELARSLGPAASQHFRAALLRGRWLPQYNVFLDNRQMGGRQGFFLVTPLELAPGEAILVQRGWAPRDLRDRLAVPAVPTPETEVTVAGRLAPPPGRLFALGGADTGAVRQNLDLESFSSETGLRLLPLSLLQVGGLPGGSPALEGASADGLKRDWPGPAVDVHRHHGYAFQWFSLCGLLTGLYVWFQLIQPWLRGRPGAR
jgi:surfeit locus 1 family protein